MGAAVASRLGTPTHVVCDRHGFQIGGERILWSEAATLAVRGARLRAQGDGPRRVIELPAHTTEQLRALAAHLRARHDAAQVGSARELPEALQQLRRPARGVEG